MQANIFRTTGTSFVPKPRTEAREIRTQMVPEYEPRKPAELSVRGTAAVATNSVSMSIGMRQLTKRLDDKTYLINAAGAMLSDPGIDPKVQRMRADRAALLSRTLRKASPTPVEDNLRIDILTERLRRAFPRVTLQERAVCKQSVDDLERSKAVLNRIDELLAL